MCLVQIAFCERNAATAGTGSTTHTCLKNTKNIWREIRWDLAPAVNEFALRYRRPLAPGFLLLCKKGPRNAQRTAQLTHFTTSALCGVENVAAVVPVTLVCTYRSPEPFQLQYDLLIGADGAGSTVREAVRQAVPGMKVICYILLLFCMVTVQQQC